MSIICNTQILYIDRLYQQIILLNQLTNKQMSRTKLTSTILTQLEQNERLRIQLHRYENMLKDQDSFYLTALNNQQQTTKNILNQLILTQVKIKELVKSRICNNWKQQYDNLSDSISQYVKDVNELVLSYNSMRQNWLQKTHQSSDLHKYYSQTLQECVQKFDKAQQIIEQMNQIIQEKDSLILKKQQQIQRLKDNLTNNYSSHKLANNIKQIAQNHSKQIKHYQIQINQIKQYLQSLKTQNETLIYQKKCIQEKFTAKVVDCDVKQQKIVNLQEKSQNMILQNRRVLQLLQKMEKIQSTSKRQLSRVAQNQQDIIKRSIMQTQKMAYLQKSLAQVERQNKQLVKMQKQWLNAQQNYQKQIHNQKQQIQHHEQLVFDLNTMNQNLRQQLDNLYSEIEQFKKRQEQNIHNAKLKEKDHKIERIKSKYFEQSDPQTEKTQKKRKKLLNIQIQNEQTNIKKQKNCHPIRIQTQPISYQVEEYQQNVLRQVSHDKLNSNFESKQEVNKKQDSGNQNHKKFNLQSFQIKNMHFQNTSCSPRIKIGSLHNWNNFNFPY